MIAELIVIFVIVALVLLVVLKKRVGGGIAKSVGNIIDQAAHNADQALKDPIRDAECAIRRGHEKIKGYRSQLRDLNAKTNELRTELLAEQAEVDKYDGYAKQFVAAGDDASAEQALKEQERHEELVASAKEDIAANEATIKDLEANIRELEDLIERSESNLGRNRARLESAKLREELEDANSKDAAENDGLLADLKAVDTAVKHQEARATAAKQTNAASSAGVARSLDEKIRGLGGQATSTSSRLAALKAQQAAASDPSGK